MEGSIKEQLEEERWKHKSKWKRERRKGKKGREKKLQVGNKESFESWSVLLPLIFMMGIKRNTLIPFNFTGPN